MPSGMHAWSLPVPITLILFVMACAYVRGWVRLRRTLPRVTHAWRLACFVGGLFSLWIAIGSPLSVLDHQSLIVHMLQHLLLMTVAAPLILLGAPAVALMHGLPQRFVRDGLGPVLRWPPLQWLAQAIAHPAFCWLAATAVVIGWHIPALFELCLQSNWWHVIEYSSFFLAGLLFWWPVVQPWQHASKQPQWTASLVSVPGYASLRRAVRISDVLRPGSLSVTLLHPSALRDVRPAGSAMGGRTDVGLGNHRLFSASRCAHDSDPLPAANCEG